MKNATIIKATTIAILLNLLLSLSLPATAADQITLSFERVMNRTASPVTSHRGPKSSGGDILQTYFDETFQQRSDPVLASFYRDMYREAPEVAHTGAFWKDDDPLRMRLNAELRWDTNPITASFRRDINHEPTSPAVVDYPADTDPLQVMINVALWTHRLSTHIASAAHRHGN